jgi:hypothetical protein
MLRLDPDILRLESIFEGQFSIFGCIVVAYNEFFSVDLLFGLALKTNDWCWMIRCCCHYSSTSSSPNKRSQMFNDRPTDRRTYEKSKTEKLACFESPPAKLVVSDEKAPPVAGKSKQIKGCEI